MKDYFQHSNSQCEVPMVMARVRYCEDCTVTIWVPGTGEQGVAGVTIAARDTLRWSLSM